ncbi:MAG TPA: hypothetical protein PLN96_11870 [Zoogloea sp.]|uniref:hypothetical protein n=1 Tax=Zoogloea sp. TaxID=49181 RepID=UPI002B88A901|nr:hypothetical protein [Zoogloea sp.]HMV17092.1 hypothetical protein [Rhodocyclaceae bacterium]HMV64015.1 hypothetical protein [Rhodocyclaceae bacterium]HMW51377.1 hypothetical protein [Rhodocyclaceae bacterium]HMY49703.1 hypothetical protein [Rhodocyclaceae bacterium]HMZ75837.1 hypothetical protein [Rhodocyclaceae bacterium]
MSKYRSIALLMEAVEAPLAAAGVVAGEAWRADEQAVGFFSHADVGLAAYVFTYGQRSGRYGINLDFPLPAEGGPLLTVPTSAEDLPLAAVIALLLEHFDVPVLEAA